MAKKAGFSDLQNRQVTRIAREKGLTCPDCGSSEPVPKDEARARSGGAADVTMRCEDCENETEMALVLSPEEAKALGLHSLEDRPEAP
jgi:RNase P subunit RPR2